MTETRTVNGWTITPPAPGETWWRASDGSTTAHATSWTGLRDMLSKDRPAQGGDPAWYQTPVIFRTFPAREGGDTIALFPYEAATADGWQCESFMHIGQHGAADPGIVDRTRQATDDEATILAHELESAPYNYTLRRLRRFPADAYAARRAQVADLRKA